MSRLPGWLLLAAAVAADALCEAPSRELGRRTCTGRGAGGLVQPLPAASAR